MWCNKHNRCYKHLMIYHRYHLCCATSTLDIKSIRYYTMVKLMNMCCNKRTRCFKHLMIYHGYINYVFKKRLILWASEDIPYIDIILCGAISTLDFISIWWYTMDISCAAIRTENVTSIWWFYHGYLITYEPYKRTRCYKHLLNEIIWVSYEL